MKNSFLVLLHYLLLCIFTSGTLELPHISDAISIEVITTPEPTIDKKTFLFQYSNCEHSTNLHVAYASKILNNSPFGKINVVVSSNSNSTFSNLHNMISTQMPRTPTLLLLVKGSTKPKNFSMKKPKTSKSQIHFCIFLPFSIFL